MFIKIFSKAITPYNSEIVRKFDTLSILTSDDLSINATGGYEYYGYKEYKDADIYNEIYRAKISEMDTEKL